MDEITLKDYRCFGKEQTARLAPLTLLVGANSTGKTSFLAIIRVLADVAFGNLVPNFREEPYDLGAFQDVVYNTGTQLPECFQVGFSCGPSEKKHAGVSFHITFTDRYGSPFPSTRTLSQAKLQLDALHGIDNEIFSRVTNERGTWDSHFPNDLIDADRMLSMRLMFSIPHRPSNDHSDSDRPEWKGITSISEDEISEMKDLSRVFSGSPEFRSRPFAGAPIRSRPRRTYDPIRIRHDAEGEYVPSYLASMYRRDNDEWNVLKNYLEEFGHDSGLFDEILVKSFGDTDGDPFQIQIRSSDKYPRNIIEVGYGISQILPVLTELLREDASNMFLFQQPEVHLHPSAQAALGGLFCNIAANGKQLIVETHSDYLIDRVRTDVRDGNADLKPEDVSILYFERNERGVEIHSIRIDEMGNVLNAPPSYRRFFMEEIRRSIGI